MGKARGTISQLSFVDGPWPLWYLQGPRTSWRAAGIHGKASRRTDHPGINVLYMVFSITHRKTFYGFYYVLQKTSIIDYFFLERFLKYPSHQCDMPFCSVLVYYWCQLVSIWSVTYTAFNCAIPWRFDLEHDVSLSAKLAEVLLTWVLVELVEQAFPIGQPLRSADFICPQAKLCDTRLKSLNLCTDCSPLALPVAPWQWHDSLWDCCVFKYFIAFFSVT